MFPEKNQDRPKKQLDQKSRGHLSDAQFDKLEGRLVRAALSSEEEINTAVSAPFLYARLQARIVAERERLAHFEASNWWAMLLTAWRPLTGMALMATFAAVLFWFTAIAGSTTNADSAMGSNDYLANGNSSFERIVFTDGTIPSNDEVLTTLMNQDETDVQR